MKTEVQTVPDSNTFMMSTGQRPKSSKTKFNFFHLSTEKKSPHSKQPDD